MDKRAKKRKQQRRAVEQAQKSAYVKRAQKRKRIVRDTVLIALCAVLVVGGLAWR